MKYYKLSSQAQSQQYIQDRPIRFYMFCVDLVWCYSETLHVERKMETKEGFSMQHDRLPVSTVSWPHSFPVGRIRIFSGKQMALLAIYCSNYSGSGALGTACKPNTSPHSIRCLINPIKGSFSVPWRQPSWHCRETKTDRLVHSKQFWGWLPFPIKV